MLYSSQILIQHVTYTLDNGDSLFGDLSLNLSAEKIGLVGRNGVGKSTLLKLITGELSADAGAIKIEGSLAYCPQQNTDLRDEGLSGGEQTRLLLEKTFSAGADFLLLDEPTNNLDLKARKWLYHKIVEHYGGVIVVSHDRELLSHMDRIVELSSLGAKTYGGNYEDYLKQKSTEVSAVSQQIQSAEQSLKSAKHSAQLRKERHQKAESRGKRAKKEDLKAKGRINKIELKSKRGRSEKTNKKILTQADRKITEKLETLKQARDQFEIVDEIRVELPKTRVPNGKNVLDVEGLTFKYPDQENAIIENFDFKIHGAERVAITGPNGSGKTTLLKLLLGQLTSATGNISFGVSAISYIDQHLDQLRAGESLLESYLRINPKATENEAYRMLASFLFKNTKAHKKVEQLSGGERIRALLACVLGGDNPPQLLILDEPTNHLDLSSVKQLESALSCYEGAMIIVSHDQVFLDKVSVTRYISESELRDNEYE